MSDISKLELSEKSEILIKAMGWRKDWASMDTMALLDGQGKGLGHPPMRPGEPMPNIYYLENIMLAWQCIRWLYGRPENVPGIPGWTVGNEFEIWWNDAGLFALHPHEAQKQWLDRVLSLAIEAGLVQP